VSALAFCPVKISSQKAIYRQKLGQNTGAIATEEAQTLLSKKDKIYNLNQCGKILNRIQITTFFAEFS